MAPEARVLSGSEIVFEVTEHGVGGGIRQARLGIYCFALSLGWLDLERKSSETGVSIACFDTALT